MPITPEYCNGASPQLSSEEARHALIALGSNFVDAYVFDLNTLESLPLRVSDEAMVDEVQDLDGADYRQILKAFIDHNITQDDRSRIAQVLTPEGIRQRLGEKPSFIERFRVDRDGVFSSYYFKCARIDERFGQDRVVVAFSPENTYSYSLGFVAPDKAGRQSRAGRRTVLIVEDSELNREMLKAIVEQEYDVLEARDGREGLELLAKYHPMLSAVLLDVYMPVCNGFEFLQASQADEELAKIPVIVTTGNSSAEEEIKCLSYGASDFLPKPYNPQVVLARLKSIIRLRESISTLDQVEHDSLTGVYTPQSFMVRSRAWINSEPQSRFHLMAVRFDKFRTLSTVLGRAKTLAALGALGQRLSKTFPDALIGRVEDDCFVCFAQFDDVPREWLTAELHGINRDCPVPGTNLLVGCYEDIDTSLPFETLVDRAILSADGAETVGAFKIGFFDGPVSQKMINDQAMEADFPRALGAGEFVPFFQPKYGVKDQQMQGAEALVRWVKADGSMVSPGAFVPLFEKTGLVSQVDQCIFQQVCSFQADRLAQGLPVVPVSVNLSRASLMAPGVLERYVAIAKDAHIPFDLVPLEITESMAVEDVEVSGVLVAFAQAGFNLHLDDFGSGYSSLASLFELPLKALKIDKTLVDRIGDNRGEILLRTVVGLAHRFGLSVVAEGVEEEYQVKFLQDTTCDSIQGYYYSPPKNQEVFATMLSQAGFVS